MKRNLTLGCVLFLLLALPGIRPRAAAAADFTLTSTSFSANSRMPLRLVRQPAGGENLSPALCWTKVPAHTRSLVLTCVDLHPVARGWVHWLVVDIPADCRALDEGASPERMPAGCRELANSFGTPGWGGPQPPPGSGEHEYRFTLYALKCKKLPAGIRTAAEVQKAIRGQVLGRATLSGWFGR